MVMCTHDDRKVGGSNTRMDTTGKKKGETKRGGKDSPQSLLEDKAWK
jgi:hypothetical protein